MRKIFLLLFLLLNIFVNAQTWTPQYKNGLVAGFTQNSILGLPMMDVSAIDTSKWRLELDYSTGLYKYVVNKVVLMGVAIGNLKVPLYYNLASSTSTIDTNSLVYLSKANTWTGTQTFDNIIANTLTLNKIDSSRSIYLYRANGSLFAYFDATKDSAYVDGNMYIRGLTGQTILTSQSVTSNKFITDTLQSHSPTLVYSDSIRFGKTKDTAMIWYNQITTGNSTRGAIYPVITLGSDLGLTTNRFKNTHTRTLNADTIFFNTTGTGGVGKLNYNGITLPSTTGILFYGYGNATGLTNNNTGSYIIFNLNGLDIKGGALSSYTNYIQFSLHTNDSSSIIIKLGGANNKHFLKLKDYNGALIGGILSTGEAVLPKLTTGNITLTALPTYPDDASAGAGGLTTGMIYKTSTGEVRIKL